MSVPRIVVNETLEIKRIAVTAEGQDITVTIAEAAAGVSTVNGQSDVVVLSTDDITEGVDNLYYTQGRADARVAAGIAAIDFPVDSVNAKTGAVVLTTSDVTEGTRLYYTSTRANSDFDTRLATKTTTNLAEGTNLYYTDARADARVAAGIGAIDYPVDSVNGKTNTVVLSTTDIGEGTNLYHTTARARSSLSGSTGISYNSTTGAIAVDSTIATKTYADSAAAAAAAAIVDSAPATLDTLNELAAALGDDANFATTVTTALGTKLNTADFNSTFDTRLATKSTTNLGEGTNLYYTSARANTDFDTRLATKSTTDLAEGTNLYYTDGRFDTRLATKTTTNLSEGTNLYYTDARVRAVVDNNVDLDVDGSNNVYVKSLRNGTRVYGGMEASTNASYVFPPQTLSTVADNNGYSAASSFPAGTTGYGANASFTHYYGDTLAGVNTAPAFNFRNANGNSSTGDVIPFTGLTSIAPSATLSGNVMGTQNYNGYGTTGFTNDIATTYQGGGINALSSMQVQSYPTENFSDSVLTLNSTNVTAVASSFRAAMGSPTVVGTKGQIQYSGTAGAVGQAVRVTGTLTGNATGIVSGQTYYMIVYSNNGTNSFATLSATPGGVPITTSGTTLTGLTLTRCSVSFTTTGLTNVPFGRGALVTVSGITNVTDGTYPVWGTPTTGTFSLGVPHTTPPTMAGAQTFSCRTVYMGAGFRIRAFPTGTPATLQNRLELLDIAPGATTIRTNSLTLNTGAYGNTGVGITGNNIIYNRVHGQFELTTTVTPAAANTAYVFPLGTPTLNNIVTVGSTSRLIPGAAGRYNFQFSVQCSNSDNSNDQEFYIWLRKNGTDVTGSTGRMTLPKSTTGSLKIVGWNFVVETANATDYFELAYAVASTQVTFPAFSPLAFAPGTSSLVTTITPIGA